MLTQVMVLCTLPISGMKNTTYTQLEWFIGCVMCMVYSSLLWVRTSDWSMWQVWINIFHVPFDPSCVTGSHITPSLPGTVSLSVWDYCWGGLLLVLSSCCQVKWHKKRISQLRKQPNLVCSFQNKHPYVRLPSVLSYYEKKKKTWWVKWHRITQGLSVSSVSVRKPPQLLVQITAGQRHSQ